MFGFNTKPVKRKIINRDPNNQLDLNGVSIDGEKRGRFSKMSLRSSVNNRSQGGALSRVRLNHERMSKLGSGKIAGKMQKDSFAKLKKISSSGSKPRLNLFK